MHLQVFLDCSASIGKKNDSKAAYGIATAAALGYLSVHNMDKVSFKLIQENGINDIGGGVIVGKQAFFRAIKHLDDAKFDGSPQISRAILSDPNVGNKDGLTVIISDFLFEDEWKKAVDYLLYKKRQVMLIQILTPEEIDPTYSGRVTLIDLEAEGSEDKRNMRLRIDRSWLKAYEEAYQYMKEDMKTFCHSRGVDYISVSIDKPFEKMLFEELLKVGLMS
jgi:uncharacterized protein (DUF58 family)